MPTGKTHVAEFMAGVYRWMAFGLGLTGLVAYAVTSSPSILSAFYRVQNGHIVGVSGLFWVIGIAELGLVFLFVPALNRVSMGAAVGMFLGYCALSGVTFSVYLLTYTTASVASTLFVTGGAFFGLSLYATVTKRDLSGMRTFLMVGLIGVLIAMVVNYFLHSAAVDFVMSCAGVLVFAGLTAYDTQKLRRLGAQGGDKMALLGALTLYLDFINLFLFLLRFMGRRRD
ncbi:MAG TPA: Bax inhibitor-1/YccA family protein [Myxococcales bacterium]|nr:Bax inhibitor-1/YccA family protein [Myxococcales bacterium]